MEKKGLESWGSQNVMIVLAGYVDLSSGIAWEIWANEERSFPIGMGLIGPLVCALDSFVRELTLAKRGFHEGHLEGLRMLVYQPEAMGDKSFHYVVFQDLYDNAEYTRRKLDRVHELIGDYLEPNSFNPPKARLENAEDVLRYTQKFPKDAITADEPLVKNMMDTLYKQGGVRFLDLFLADIDEGMVVDFIQSELIEKAPARLFHDILESVEFEESLYLETIADTRVTKGLGLQSLHRILLEAWYVIPLKNSKLTDFYLVGYFAFNPNRISCQEIQSALQTVSYKLYEKIKEYLPDSPAWIE